MAKYMLVVEVASAHIPVSSDGNGYTNAFVELNFGSQQFLTTVKEKGVRTTWNECFYFNVPDPSGVDELVLEACVYNTNRSIQDSKSFHGMARIIGPLFRPLSDAVASPYPLEQTGMFTRVRGDLVLKVYIADDASIRASNPLLALALALDTDQTSIPHNIPLHHLKEITNNFSHTHTIGSGGSARVYKGVLPNRKIIAVKKILQSSNTDLGNQFENEVCHLMTLKHPNIVRCLGYCYETQHECLDHNEKYILAGMEERLLCLEYLPRGSLDRHLTDESSGLDWSTRYKIIQGVCYGLYYLHEQTNRPIFHLDLKPANILLDDSFAPKITDFGLSRPHQQKTISTSSKEGTLGYMPPELFQGGKITPKSDIFSLGVIIVEVITGDKPDITGKSSEDSIDIMLRKWRNKLQRSPTHGSLELDCEQIKRCIQAIYWIHMWSFLLPVEQQKLMKY
ncbi:probable serine/threonine-protein kinase PBL22 isoform X3 [Lolium rigidum]|uniref:probable serine/threonine-protein kinase PBL22 isoform X3 n=1 Tax=Lolium rigidum TaxID=89674 RepID=UPI001F5DC5F7|nr:probable serine/threonine-protein kinase PBL22 isoform X3 [Lolium rigidum]